MAKKRRIKSRKNRIDEYNSKYKGVPKYDPIERVMYCIGDKLTEKRVKDIINRKKRILEKRSYSCINITIYEEPVQSERPRYRSIGGFISPYVPNAKDNKNYITKFIKKLRKDINIHTPMFIKINFYHPMPSSASIEEQVLFEAGIIPPATKPDIDNAFKTYTDSLIGTLLLDDDLIYKAHIEKFYSFLPRIEMTIYYEDKFTSIYVYKKIKNRKSFKSIPADIEISDVIS